MLLCVCGMGGGEEEIKTISTIWLQQGSFVTSEELWNRCLPGCCKGSDFTWKTGKMCFLVCDYFCFSFIWAMNNILLTLIIL